MEEQTRSTIARIDIMQGDTSVSRGTGALVSDNLVLTAMHVVADRKQDPPAPLDGEIVLTFPGGNTRATIEKSGEGLCGDRVTDWVLLRCEEPPPVRPLPLAELTRSGVEWMTHGFPEAAPPDGLVHTGTVTTHRGRLQHQEVLQLHSQEAAAGNGAPAKGLSGAPVIVDGAMVGVLRFALMDKQRQTVAGTLYGCPIHTVLDKTDDRLPVPDPCFGLPGLPRKPLPSEPFRYLNWFTEDQAEIFFGRNAEIRDLYRYVTHEDMAPIILLYGQSGVGKSSFLEAGLNPRLEWHHEVRYQRRNPRRSLRDALRGVIQAAVGGKPDEAEPGAPHEDVDTTLDDLWRAVERGTGRPLVVTLDQLEEAWIRPRKDDDDEIEDFFDGLAELFGRDPADADAPLRGRLILGFRKEWVPELQKQLEARGLAYQKVFLEPLDREAIIEVVEGLTRTERLRAQYGLSLDPDLPGRIAEKLKEDPDSSVAPTLQILLTKMWERAPRDKGGRRFTKALYDKLSDEGMFLRDFLAQRLKVVGEEHPAALRSGLVLDVLNFHVSAMVTSEEKSEAEVRERYSRHAGPDEPPAEGHERGGRHDEPLEIGTLVQTLIGEYLLVDSSDEEGSATRLIHDTLAPHVRREFARSTRIGQRARRILSNRIQEWTDDSDGEPLSRTELKIVSSGQSGMRNLTKIEQRLVDASRKKVGRQTLLRRSINTAAGVLLAAVIGGAIYMSFLWRGAEADKTMAQLQVQTQKVYGRLTTDPTAGLIVALASVRDSLGSQNGTLITSLQRSFNWATEYAREENRLLVDGDVKSIAISYDNVIAAGTASGGLHLWDFHGEPLWNKEAAHDLPIVGVAFDPATGRLASIGWDSKLCTVPGGREDCGELRIWDRQGNRVATHQGTPFRSLAFLPDGKLVLGGQDGFVRLWDDPESGKEIRRWDGHSGPQEPLERPVLSLAAILGENDDHEDLRIVSGGADGTVRLWSPEGAGSVYGTPSVCGALKNEICSVNAVDIKRLPRYGMCVVSGGRDGAVRLWDDDGNEIEPFPYRGHTKSVTTVAFNETGNVILSGSRDQTIHLTLLSGRLAAPIFRGMNEAVTSAGFGGPTGREIVVGSDDGTVRIRDARGDQIGNELAAPVDNEDPVKRLAAVYSVSMSPEGDVVAAADKNGRLFFWSWNPRDASLVGSVVGAHDKECDIPGVYKKKTSVAFSRDGRKLASASCDGAILQWSPDGRPMGFITKGGEEKFTAIEFDPSGDYLASGDTLGRVRVWDVHGQIATEPAAPDPAPDELGRCITDENDESGFVTVVTYSPDGALLASADTQGRVKVWRKDNETWTLQACAPGGEEPKGKQRKAAGVRALAFHPDGRSLAFGDDRYHIWTWDLDDELTLLIERAHNGKVRALGFHPDGKILYSTGEDTVVRMWNYDDSGRPLTNGFFGHGGGYVFDLSVGPDGRTLATAGQDGRVVLWRAHWRVWLEVACSRLRNHPVFRDPDQPICERVDCGSARALCDEQVWDRDPEQTAGRVDRDPA